MDPTGQKQAVNVKHMKSLKKKVEQKHKDKWKHPEYVKDPDSPRWCLGPSCVYPTQPGSKYCLDDYGMKLAGDHINNILPQCIQQWQRSPCFANEHGKKMLERIHHEQQDTYTHLKDMECHFHELEAIILRGKHQAVCVDY
ncbi:hypothetical protein P7K49_038073 [Saguinus oedipus]|uniref:CXXC-type zinc finger protein 1 n=1 Tax=Saguinus oedipus TaxID=9490 RepID=A0ABQ9TF22_SAGOE|nr:hypothetical protein P7K49_038073 [Saguinus oedipus]